MAEAAGEGGAAGSSLDEDLQVSSWQGRGVLNTLIGMKG
jgi:hypothetical protein